MTRLPRVSGKDLVRALQRNNFLIKRQSGSHVIMVHAHEPSRRCTIPVHANQIIKPGTLHSILKGAQMSNEELIDLL